MKDTILIVFLIILLVAGIILANIILTIPAVWLAFNIITIPILDAFFDIILTPLSFVQIIIASILINTLRFLLIPRNLLEVITKATIKIGSIL